jgi:hypothetical protein
MIKYILQEMFKRVGQEYTEEFVKQPYWFTKYSWTEEEQEDFENWLYTELKNNNLLRKETLANNTKSAKQLKRVAKAFVFNYGWSLRE